MGRDCEGERDKEKEQEEEEEGTGEEGAGEGSVEVFCPGYEGLAARGVREANFFASSSI